MLDSVLYHLSTRLIFEESIPAVHSSFPHRVIAKYIHVIDHERAKSRSSLVLPVLGRIPPALFLQIYYMTWLSRQYPLGVGSNHELALQCLTEINRLASECKVPLPGRCSFAQDGHDDTNSTIGTNLYFLAAQIFAHKLEGPGRVYSTSTEICHLLVKGLDLLKNYDANARFGQFICWPLLIFGCAACPNGSFESTQGSFHSMENPLHAELRSTIQCQLLRIWETSHSGHVKRTMDTLERVWEAFKCSYKRTTFGSFSAEIHDGLDALICQNGVTRIWSA